MNITTQTLPEQITDILDDLSLDQIERAVRLIGQSLFNCAQDSGINLHLAGITHRNPTWIFEFQDSVTGDEKFTYTLEELDNEGCVIILEALQWQI